MGTELATYLVKHDIITAGQADELLQRMVLTGGSFDTQLLECDILDEASCLKAMHDAFGIAIVTKQDIDATPPEVAITFPLLFAQMHNLVPHRFRNGALVVLAAVPPKSEEMANIIQRLGVKVEVLITTEARIHYALNKMYGLEIPPRFSKLLAKIDGQSVNKRSIARMKAVWSLTRKPIPEQNIAVGEVSQRIDAASLRKELIKAGDRDVIVDLLLEAVLTNFNFVALFTVIHNTISGWAAMGGSGDERVQDISLDLDTPNMLQTVVKTESPYLGRVPKTATNHTILETMGRPWPTAAFLAPLRVSGKVVAVLYGDTSICKFSNESVKDLLVIVAAAARGLENVIVQNKRQLQKSLEVAPASPKEASQLPLANQPQVPEAPQQAAVPEVPKAVAAPAPSAEAVPVAPESTKAIPEKTAPKTLSLAARLSSSIDEILASIPPRVTKEIAPNNEPPQDVATPEAASEAATQPAEFKPATNITVSQLEPEPEKSAALAAATDQSSNMASTVMPSSLMPPAIAITDDDTDDDDGWDDVAVEADTITSLPGIDEVDDDVIAAGDEELAKEVSAGGRSSELIQSWNMVIAQIRTQKAPAAEDAEGLKPASAAAEAADLTSKLKAAIHELLGELQNNQLDPFSFEQVVSQLLSMPDDLLIPRLKEVFPGTLTVDPFVPGVRLPVPEELSAVLALLMHLGQRAEPVIKSGLSSSDPRHRFVAAYILSRVYLPQVIEDLGILLYDSESKVRFAAAYAMRRYCQTPEYEQVLSSVREQLNQSDLPGQLSAIQMLSQLRDSRSVPELIDILHSGSTALITSATAALLTITGQAYGNNIQYWLAWWQSHHNLSREYWLLEGLVHQDPTVRQVANAELQAITGFNAGFNPRDSEEKRQAALTRWQNYFASR